MLTAVVGAEDDAMLRPRDAWVVKLEPGRAENDRVVAEARDVELDVLCMRSDLQTDRVSLVGDGAGRNTAAIDDLYVLRGIFGAEVDGVGLSKGGIDKGD